MESGSSQSSLNRSSNSQIPSWMPTRNESNPGAQDDDTLDLGGVLSFLKRRAWIIVGVTILMAAAAGTRGKTNPTYLTRVQIYTKPATAETKVVSSLPQSPTAEGQLAASDSSKGLDGTTLQLLLSPKLLDPVVAQLKSTYPIDYWTLLNNLQVKPVGETAIFEATYKDSDPKRSKVVIKALADRYVAYSLEERLSEVKQGMQFVDSQLPELRNKVSNWQARLQAFRQRNDIFEPESQSKEISAQVQSFRQERLTLEVQLKQLTAQYADLQTQINRSPVDRASAVALRQSDFYKNVLGQLLTVEGKIAEQSSIQAPDNPEMKMLVDQRANLIPLLDREAQRAQNDLSSQIRDLSSRNEALKVTESQLSQRTKNLSVQAREYTEIQRELKVATDNLEQFLAKRSALTINAGQQQATWQQLTPTTDPVLSSVQSNLVIGGVLGLLLGTITALMIDRVGNVFYATNDVKKAGKLPLLGVIPFNRELPQLERSNLSAGKLFDPNKRGVFAGGSSHKFGTLPFLEAFRLLQTNLRLLSAEKPLSSLVISSPTAQDGKSTMATYLAQVAASMGQRVLLVDAELRMPQIHTRLGLSNQQGLSDLIMGTGDVKEYAQRSPLNDQIDVLTAGQIPMDPIALLSSQRMQQLMAQFKTQYDLVIYDTPPLGGLSDAHLVAANADGLLLVTRIRKTNRDAYKHVLETLRMLPTRVLGVVVNDVKTMPPSLQKSYYAVPGTPARQPLPAIRS